MVLGLSRSSLEASICTDSLADFSQMGWHNVEARKLQWNWHHDAICEHLQAITRGEIRYLIINVPPRHTKSLLCNVIWPAWNWLHNPWHSYIFASYRTDLSERDNAKSKRLLESPWFEERFEPRVDPERNKVTRWGIVGGGERIIASVGGRSSTGDGGDAIVIDDAISADGAKNPNVLKATIDWFEDTMKTRFNDPKVGVFLIIQQRLHEYDLTGHILAHETGFDHLCLPARYEPDHPHPIRSSLGFKDPRTKAGELLWKGRFDSEELNKIAKEGTMTEAGQLQQRPAPKGGLLFKRSSFKMLKAAPICRIWVRGWDLAASIEETAAYTASVRVGIDLEGRVIVDDVTRDRLEPAPRDRLIRQTAMQDAQEHPAILGSLPQDPGQAGVQQKLYFLSKVVNGYTYKCTPESGDKEVRAQPVAAQVDAGNVYLVEGDWNKAFLDELTVFPNGKFKDQVDAFARAYNETTAIGTASLWSVRS